MLIRSKTPVRIAFGGGATDVEPYSTENGGFVVNATIDSYFNVSIAPNYLKSLRVFMKNKLTHNFNFPSELDMKNIGNDLIKATIFLLNPTESIDIQIKGDPPERAGLGASASLCCSLLAAILKFQGKSIKKDTIAELAYKVEQEILRNEGGRQDQYAAVYGGINCLEFLGGSKVKVEKLKITESFKKELETSLVLYYTGIRHRSGNLVEKQVKAYKQNREESTMFLDALKSIAYQIKDALLEENLELFGKLMTNDLDIKRKFNPFLTTEKMKQLHHIIVKKGAFGGRVCGAGGGGSMIWALPALKRESIINYLKTQSGEVIDFKLVYEGLKVQNK